MPPIKKFARNPSANSMGVGKLNWPPHIVPIQLKNLTPVGTAIRNETAEKNGSTTAPVVSIWCAHTPIDSPAIANVASTSPVYPDTGLRENTAITSVTTPKYGRIITYTSGCPRTRTNAGRESHCRRDSVEEVAREMAVDEQHNHHGREHGKRHEDQQRRPDHFPCVKIGMRHIVMPGVR